MIQIPRLLEPQDLEYLIHDERLIIVDLSNHALYQQKHVPGAVHLRGNAEMLDNLLEGLCAGVFARRWSGARH